MVDKPGVAPSKIPTLKIPTGQNPDTQNPEIQNPDRVKIPTGQNPDRSKSRHVRNPEKLACAAIFFSCSR